MKFGITLKPDSAMSIERIIQLMQRAEKRGFQYGWLYDSHILRRDPYPLLTLIAHHTRLLHLGPCVTNPSTRDPSVTASILATLQEISGGRIELGIGRGDSALRLIGREPASLSQLTAAVHTIRTLAEGHTLDMDGRSVQLRWARGRLPIWIAGYGPRVLRLAGRIADGVILQFADPNLVRWCLNFVAEGRRETGRPVSSVKIMIASPVWLGSNRREAYKRLRWFPSVISNHVIDLIKTHGLDGLPQDLTEFVRDRPAYDYTQHGNMGTPNADFIPDPIVERFCIVGSIDEHRKRLKELQALGVNQFNVYLMVGDEEAQIDTYGEAIIPYLS